MGVSNDCNFAYSFWHSTQMRALQKIIVRFAILRLREQEKLNRLQFTVKLSHVIVLSLNFDLNIAA